jgi:hypothetical protein
MHNNIGSCCYTRTSCAFNSPLIRTARLTLACYYGQPEAGNFICRSARECEAVLTFHNGPLNRKSEHVSCETIQILRSGCRSPSVGISHPSCGVLTYPRISCGDKARHKCEGHRLQQVQDASRREWVLRCGQRNRGYCILPLH